MKREQKETNGNPVRDGYAFVAAILVLACLLAALSSCGDEDLIFPGEIPFTPTSEPTDTPDPDEDDEV